MKTRQRVLFALVSALLLAAACTFVLQRTMLRASAANRASLRYYSTPSHNIHPGDLLRQEDIRQLSWPAGDAVRGAVSRPEDILNRVALSSIAPGQPILDAHLAPVGSGTGLAGRIPTGMRAIAIKSDELIGVAGFLNPGSHVDVLVTCHNGFSSDAVTSTVLQNVEVVATNQQTEPNPNGKPTTATVVTLLLTPSQAERALLASNQGSLQLVLRNSSDSGTSDEAPVALSQIATLPSSAATPGLAAGVPSPFAAPSPPRTDAPAARHAPKPPAAADSGVEMVYGGHANQPGTNLSGGKL